MSFDSIIVLIIITFILVSFYTELVGPAFTFIIAIAALGLFHILTPGEMLNGFANEQIVVVILLLTVSDIIRKTKILDNSFNKLFMSSGEHKNFLLRMMAVLGSISAFINNTPLVAISLPYVNNWSKKNGVAQSKLMIPLSYSIILGGCITLIGTSGNLIVNGLYADQKIIEGVAPLGIFDFTCVGLPMFVIGIAYLYFFSNKLLPVRKNASEDFSVNTRKYVVEAQIRPGSHLIGKTIEQAGLRNLKGLYLFGIIRNGYDLAAVSHDVVLNEGDILNFAGDTGTIGELVNSKSGLTFPEVGMLYKKSKTELIEIVVSHNSTLIAKTVKEANFRGMFDAAIIAIHRNGEKITGKIGSVKLKAGDAILLLSGSDFTNRAGDTHDFYLLSKVTDFRKIAGYKPFVLIGGFVIAVLLSAFNIIPLFESLVVLIIAILLLKIETPQDVIKSIDFNLALIIALSLALGTAMVKTGLAGMIADLVIFAFLPLGKIGVLAGIYLVTTLLAAYITNKAAIALIFPISMTAAHNLHLNPAPFALVIAFAAAANFMTPIGYQTNLMVYGPGGYTFRDFFRIGFPLTFIYMVVTVLILSWVYF